jgi:hypothetical protein
MRRRREEHDAARKARRARADQAHGRRMEAFHLRVRRTDDGLDDALARVHVDALLRGGGARVQHWLSDDD